MEKDYKNQVKYDLGNYAAIAYEVNLGWQIWGNFTRPDVVLGYGETEQLAWKDAYERQIEQTCKP
jgi:hypothetical protein